MSDPRIAAIRYAPGQPVRDVLDGFIAHLKGLGVEARGLVQERAAGHGMDAIDIRTGERIPLKRPSQYEMDKGLCSLNLSQLAEATMVLRRALEENAEAVLVERFGKTERDGGGLADDLLALMAAGVPTVVSVPEEEMDAWKRFSGGLGVVLPCELDALTAWWANSA